MSTRATLKSFFETGDKPNQAQFYDLIDSLFHKTEDSVSWTEIAGKPTTFAPSAHTHAWADLTGVPTTFAPSAHTHAWADLTGVPTTFAPSAHVHSAGEITTGLFHPSRIGAGPTTDGYIVQLVAGVPTWVVAPSGGGSGYINPTNGYLPVRTSATSFGNSIVQDDGSKIGVGGSPYNVKIRSYGVVGVVASGTGFDDIIDPAGASVSLGHNGTFGFLKSWSSSPLALISNGVGIGTTAPSYSLDVNGTARIVTVPTITTATKMLVKDPTTGQISEQLLPSGGGSGGWNLGGTSVTTPSTQYLGTNTAQELWVKTGVSGLLRAAFGVAAPAAVPALGTMGGASLFINSGDNTVPAYGMIMGANASTGASYIQSQAIGSATAYPLLLQPKGNGVRIRTESDFKGFGATLHANGMFAVSNTWDLNNGLSIDGGAAGVTYVDLQTWGQNLALNMRGNNVGVGTSTPSATLHVSGSTKVSISGTTYFEVDGTGKVFLRNAPVFASEAAAAGLATDTLYKTATGELRIKL